MAVHFNGTDLSAHMDIGKISRDILPPRIVRMIEVPSRSGAYFQSVKHGVRSYTIPFRIKGSSYEDLQDKVNVIAGILATEEPKELFFDREPDKTFYAICVEDTSFDPNVTVARGSMQFLCVDPFKYSQEFQQDIVANPIVLNDGTADIHPTFNVFFKDEATHFSIVTDDRILLVGKPETVTTVRKPRLELVATNGLSSLTGWTAGTRVDGTVSGTMTNTTAGSGTFIASNYGTGTGWHGPALKQSLPEPVQDFRFDIFGYLIANSIQEIGRIEAYLLDVNNNVVAKLAMKDMHKDYENNWGEIRVGESTNPEHIINEYGARMGVWNNFNGMLRIERVGQTITAFIGKYDFQKKVYHTRASDTFIDKNNEYQAPIAQIQLHIASYGTYKPVATASWDYFNLWKVNELTADETNVIFKAGDELVIDNAKKVIYKNGEVYMKEKSFDSQWIRLKPGQTEIAFSPDINVVDVDMTYRKRWY
jgi:predicted phage tail component-like protein